MGCNSSSNNSVIDIKNPIDDEQNNKEIIDTKEEKQEKDEKEKKEDQKEEKEEKGKKENKEKKGKEEKKEKEGKKGKEGKKEENGKKKSKKEDEINKKNGKNEVADTKRKEDLKKSQNKTKEEDNKKKDNKEKKEENIKESVNKKSEEVLSSNKKIEVNKEIYEGVILMKGLEEVIAENLSKNQVRRLVEDALNTKISGDKDMEKLTEEQIKAIASILYNKIHKKEINMNDFPELKGINVRIGAEKLTKDIIRKMLFNNNNEVDEFQIDLTYTNLTRNNNNIKALSIEIL